MVAARLLLLGVTDKQNMDSNNNRPDQRFVAPLVAHSLPKLVHQCACHCFVLSDDDSVAANGDRLSCSESQDANSGK
jgi:hypothetical protein